MIDFTKYNELVKQEAELKKAQQEELARIGFDEELDRLTEAEDMDGLNEIAQEMADARLGGAKRFVYERLYVLDEILEKKAIQTNRV